MQVSNVPTAEPEVRAKIEILWPQGDAPVKAAERANITAYLMSGVKDPPPCAWNPVVRLWRAENIGPAYPVATAAKRMVVVGENRYPVWDFNDIDVTSARNPVNKLTFFVTVDNTRSYHNLWVHAADARTILPQSDVPTAVTIQVPSAVDARIEIVWPHDNLPVARASLVNVTAYLFEAGTLRALSPDIRWNPTVRLHWSMNTETEQPGTTGMAGVMHTVSDGGVKFLAWDFNDVDVQAARDPGNRIYFWLSVDGVPTYSNIWVHGADGRTISPGMDVLNSCH